MNKAIEKNTTPVQEGIWPVTTGELAQMYNCTVRRVQQLGQEGMFRPIGRNSWDSVWCLYAVIGSRVTENMDRKPGILARVAVGWLNGWFIGTSVREGLRTADASLWVEFCRRRGVGESSALQALGVARHIYGG
jgi:hypothetical protein